MKKILFLILISILFISCSNFSRKINYKIKKVENGYKYVNFAEYGYVCLTSPIGEAPRDSIMLGRVYLAIKIISNEKENNHSIILLRSGKESYILNKELINDDFNKYDRFEILNDIIITKKDGGKIIIKKNKISKEILLSEELTGPISIEFGNIEIGDSVYHIPKIYIQKHKKVEYNTLLGVVFLDQEFFTIKENWIED